MDASEFKASVDSSAPPDGLSPALEALWHDAKGDWDSAHKRAQDQDDALGAWVHAYLHRVEGDEANAGYWYKKAGKPPCVVPLSEEWDVILAVLL